MINQSICPTCNTTTGHGWCRRCQNAGQPISGPSFEQRYKNAIRKQSIISRQQVRESLAGTRDIIACTTDGFIIEAIAQAYRAGWIHSERDKRGFHEREIEHTP